MERVVSEFQQWDFKRGYQQVELEPKIFSGHICDFWHLTGQMWKATEKGQYSPPACLIYVENDLQMLQFMSINRCLQMAYKIKVASLKLNP